MIIKIIASRWTSNTFTPKKENFQKFEIVLPFGEFLPKEKTLTPNPSPTGNHLVRPWPTQHPLSTPYMEHT